MENTVVDLQEKLALFTQPWSPKLVANLNDYEVKLVKMLGEFVWHSHQDTDELFLVISGELTISLRDSEPGDSQLRDSQLRDSEVRVGPGQLFVVPRGVEHRPYATGEVQALLIEPRGVINTGDAGGELTAEVDPI